MFKPLNSFKDKVSISPTFLLLNLIDLRFQKFDCLFIGEAPLSVFLLGCWSFKCCDQLLSFGLEMVYVFFLIFSLLPNNRPFHLRVGHFFPASVGTLNVFIITRLTSTIMVSGILDPAFAYLPCSGVLHVRREMLLKDSKHRLTFGGSSAVLA